MDALPQRAGRALSRLLPALILLAAAAPFWPALLGQRSMLSFDSRLFPPFSAEAPADLASRPANFVTSDLNAFVYPGAVHTRREIRAGRLPLWDPWQLAGQPSLANLPVASFYPPNWLMLCLDPLLALAWITVLHLALGGMFCFLFLRLAGLGVGPALLSGIGLALCSWMTVRFHQFHVPCTGAWFFGWLYGVERLLKAPRLLNFVVLAGVAGGTFLAGFPQLAVIEAAGAGLYLGVRLLERGRELRLRCLWMFGAAVVTGMLLAAVHLLPTSSLLPESLRRTMVESTGAAERGLRPAALIDLLLPEFFGPAVDREGLPAALHEYLPHRLLLGADVQENPVENALWPGGALLLLGLLGFGAARHHGAARALLVLLFAGLCVSLRSPLLSLLLELFPGLAAGSPKRSLILVALPLVALAGFGLAPLLAESAGAGRRRAAWLSLALFALLAAVLCLARFLDPGRLLGLLAPGGGPAAGTVLEAEQFGRVTFEHGWPRALCYLVLAALLWFASLDPRRLGGRWLLIGTAALILVELVDFAKDFNPLQERGGQYPETKALTFLKESGERSVRFGDLRLAAASLSALFPFRSLDGVQPLILHRFGEYLENIEPGLFDPDDPRLAGALLRPASLAHPAFLRAATPLVVTGVPLPEEQGLELVYRGDLEGLGIYRQTRALPRVRLVGGYRVVTDPRERLALLADPLLDATREVLLEQPPEHPIAAGPIAGEIVLDQELPGRLALRVRSLSNPALLVIAENHHSGWKATVDGEPATVLVADHTFQALSLSAGDHGIELVYRPLAVTAGLWLSAAALILLLSLLWVALRRSRSGPGFIPGPAARSGNSARRPGPRG